MAKYLDENGLLYFWQQLKAKFADKVDKETGKGLSTNDFTTTLKNKLDGISAGAEVNVNADWSATSGDAQILNKPSIPSKTSDLTNDSDFVEDASYVHTDNNFSDAEKGKADGALQKKSAAGIVYSAANETTTSAATASQIVSAIGNTAVARATGDASGNSISGTYAPKVSPALTGTPTAPTATAGTNTTQIATTEFVTNAIATAVTGSSAFQGTVSAQSTIQNSNYKKGWFWVVDTAGTYVGQTCEVGDMIYAIRDKASAYAAADFSVVQTNLDIASITNAEIDAILAA